MTVGNRSLGISLADSLNTAATSAAKSFRANVPGPLKCLFLPLKGSGFYLAFFQLYRNVAVEDRLCIELHYAVYFADAH